MCIRDSSIASLVRDAGEAVSGSPYNITAVVYNSLTGSAAGNYSLANAFSNAPVLNITAKALNPSIANQSKVYGANDPTLSGIGVTLGGIVNNNAINTWNGNVSINDTGNVATTLSSLTRAAGETVSGSECRNGGQLGLQAEPAAALFLGRNPDICYQW